MFHAVEPAQCRGVSALSRVMSRRLPGDLALPFGRLVRMRRARLVHLIARLARALGRFDRVRVVTLLGRGSCRGLLLLIDHDRNPYALARATVLALSDELTVTSKGRRIES